MRVTAAQPSSHFSRTLHRFSERQNPPQLERRAGSLSTPETSSENPPSPAVMAGVGGSGSGGGGGGDAEMGGWTGLLHSSTKLLEQAAPTPHFPPLQVRARRRPPFLPQLFSLPRCRRRLHLFPSAPDGFVSGSCRGTWTSSRRSPPSSRLRPSALRLRPSHSPPPGR